MGSVIARARGILTFLCVLAIFAVPLWFVAAGFGTRIGLWDWRFGLEVMTAQTGPVLLIGAMFLAGLALLANIPLLSGADTPPNRAGALAAAVLVVVAGTGFYQVHTFNTQTGRFPAIHDITTDTQNPPQFTAALIARRGAGANSVDYAGKTDPSGRPLAAVQAEAYPGIVPAMLRADQDMAYLAALRVARDMGWTVSTQSGRERMFEATATGFLYGFRDDVVVRVSEGPEGGSRVDARSVSRERDADRGANAARLQAFLVRLREQLGEG